MEKQNIIDQKCSQCQRDLVQKEGNMCVCGHTVTKEEENLYTNNNPQEIREGRDYGTGILGQLFFGTLGILFIMYTIHLPKDGNLAMIIAVTISYNPFFYVNSKNAKWQRIAVWTVFLALIAWPIIAKIYS